jgi:hypothetical protein
MYCTSKVTQYAQFCWWEFLWNCLKVPKNSEHRWKCYFCRSKNTTICLHKLSYVISWDSTCIFLSNLSVICTSLSKTHIMFCYNINFLDLNWKYNHMGRSRRSWRTLNMFNIIIWMHSEAWACIFPILAKTWKIIEIVSSITPKMETVLGNLITWGCHPCEIL